MVRIYRRHKLQFKDLPEFGEFFDILESQLLKIYFIAFPGSSCAFPPRYFNTGLVFYTGPV